jgi:UDP:flavonoid glycosyltransferase YjiC (YdhE family)
MTNGKKILFAPASNILFHVGRCLGLSKELSRRGHESIFVGTPRYLQDPAITNGNAYEFHELPDFEAEPAMEILRSLRQRPSERFLRDMVEPELRLLERLQPDLIIADFRLTMYLSARVLKIPIVSLLLAVWMQPYMAAPPRMIRTYPQLRWLSRLLGQAGIGLLTPAVLRLIVRYKTVPFARAARRLGLTPAKFLWDLLIGDFNLLLDTDAWSPTKPLPPHFCRVGPILWEPDLPLPTWIDKLDRGRPVIYINLGSTAHRDLFARLFADFAGTPYQVIMATGGQIDPKDFQIPDNCYVERLLPVGKIMQYSDLVIYHGGAGTAYQIMRAGLPSIVIATHLDQEHQGLATEAHQVGISLTMHEVLANPGLILEATARIIRDLTSYRLRIDELRRDLLRYDGPITAADYIENFLHGSGAKRRAAERKRS